MIVGAQWHFCGPGPRMRHGASDATMCHMSHCCEEVLAALTRIESLLKPEAPRPKTLKPPVTDEHVKKFIASNFIFGSPRSRASTTDIYLRYMCWCEENLQEPLSINRLGTALTALGFQSVRGAAGTRYRVGIELA